MISDSVPARTPEPEPREGEPSTARTAQPRWLIPIAVAVVLLATGIGLVVGLTLTGHSLKAGAGAAAAASYVPADATFYYEMRLDLPGDQRANLRTFLGHFSKVDPDKYLTDALDKQLDDMTTAMPSGYRYSTDVKPWFDGTVAVAMIGSPSMVPGSKAPGTNQIPDMLIFAGVKSADAASTASDRIRADATKNGATVRSTTHGSATIWSVEQPPGSNATHSPPFAWTITADQVVAGTSADLVGRALDVHGGSGASLANRQAFRDGLARLPADRVGVVSFDSAPMLAQLKKEAAAAAPSLAGLVDSLDGYLPTFVVESGRFEANRFMVDATATMPSAQAANRDLGLAALAPGDALFYADGADGGKGLAAFVNALKAAVTAQGGSTSAQLDQAEKVLGGDLSSFVSWIRDASLVAGETAGTPYAGLIITPTSSRDASVKLLRLQGLIQLGTVSGGTKVTVTDADHNGTRITTIRVDSGATAPSWAKTFQYAVTDSRVVIGMGDGFVARVLDMQAANSLAGQQRFRAALDSVGGSSNRGSVWLDLAGLRAALEPLIPSSSTASYQSEVRPSVSPFDYLVLASRSEGSSLESHLAIVVK